MRKSKLAIDYCNINNVHKPLIITPALVIENGWKTDKIPQWNNDENFNPTFIQYASFIRKNKLQNIDFDSVIMDEGHHITEKCKDVIFDLKHKFNNKPVIILSATINNEKMELLNDIFGDIYVKQIGMPKAIYDKRLPSPQIVFIKCHLKLSDMSTYLDLNDKFEYYKERAEGNNYMSIMMKRTAKDIYEWLSDKKISTTRKIAQLYKDYGKLIFCSNIEQCDELSPYSVHSKNKKSKELIEQFNKGKMKTLTSCRVLLEGVNLKRCKIGIFNYISPTLRIQTQACGRIIRHKEPVFVYPYFENTREEKITNDIYYRYKEVSKITVLTEEKINELYDDRRLKTRGKRVNTK